MARSRGARHRLRRRAADRRQPRAGGAGSESHAAARQPRSRGAGRCRRSRRALDAFHAGLLLGPRVNAGGRVGEADLGARLLSTDDPVEARALAVHARYAQRRARAPSKPGARPGDRRRSRRAGGRGSRSCSSAAKAGIPASSASSRAASRNATTGRLSSSRLGERAIPAKARAARSPGFDLGAAVIAARQAGLLSMAAAIAWRRVDRRPIASSSTRFLAARNARAAEPRRGEPAAGVADRRRPRPAPASST